MSNKLKCIIFLAEGPPPLPVLQSVCLYFRVCIIVMPGVTDAGLPAAADPAAAGLPQRAHHGARPRERLRGAALLHREPG